MAGEALRQAENDLNVSLNALVDPEANTALQVLLDERKEGKRKRNRGETEADGQAVEEIVAMGFDRQIGESTFLVSDNSDV